jgi:chemotaxis protein CheX
MTAIDDELDVVPFAPSEEELTAIVGDVWSSFIGEAPEPFYVENNAAGTDVVSGTVSITGTWQGHVVVDVTPAAATLIAAAFLSLDDPAEVAADDISDALGELVNMVGGNVKSLAPSPSALSLPLVVHGGASAPDTTSICRTTVLWNGEPIVVTVLAAVTSSKNPTKQGSAR